MTKTRNDGERLPWTTPQLRRIEAGSAEALKAGGLNDGGGPGSDKS
jgi:hypothetical protein